MHRQLTTIWNLIRLDMNIAIRLIALLLLSGFCLAEGCGSFTRKPSSIPESLRDRAVQQLTDTMNRHDQWVKVHAAEFLLRLGHRHDVKETFDTELELYGDQSQYRIGIWRVLVQASVSDKSKQQWIDKIKTAFEDQQGKDRIHAAETLAKLAVPLSNDTRLIAAELVNSDDPALATYTQWALVADRNRINRTQADNLIALLDSKNQRVSQIAAYALRYQKNLMPDNWRHLAKKALSETVDSSTKVYMLSAAMVTASPSDMTSTDFYVVKSALLALKDSQKKSVRYELCMALAQQGTIEDLPLLVDFLKNKNYIREGIEGYQALSDEQLVAHPFNTDVRAAAAYAILCIDRR